MRMGRVEGLYLSENALSGEIPAERAVVLVYQRGVHRGRYVRLRGVGALHRARGGDVHRSGRGAGCRQPHLHHPADGAGPREDVSGVDERVSLSCLRGMGE